jgi:drug/metabolite transporter (DMT)-like permease
VSPWAVALVLLSAAAHAYWNLEVKRSPQPALYVWWLMLLGAALFTPVALCLAWPPAVPPLGWACVAATGGIYAAYFSFIAHSYGQEELSRAYPIARGVAPAAAALLGILLFHERPTIVAGVGILAISCGIVALVAPTSGTGEARVSWRGIVFAAATGLCSAAYGAVDKLGVRLVHPALYIILTYAVGVSVNGVTLRPWKRRAELLGELRRGGVRLAIAGLLSVGSYLLILLLFQTERLSYVLPLRSVSVLLSIWMGRQLLGEGAGLRRYAAGGVILAGMVSIALGG